MVKMRRCDCSPAASVQINVLPESRSREMTTRRKVEVFSAGCAACEETIEMVKRADCPSCEVTVHDMKDIDVAKREGARHPLRAGRGNRRSHA